MVTFSDLDVNSLPHMSHSQFQSALSDAGVIPSDSVKYSHDDVAEAIEDAFGSEGGVRLQCDINGRLTEVWGKGV